MTFLWRGTLRIKVLQAILIVILSLFLFMGLAPQNSWPLRVTFLAVGNADCAVLELPGKQVWMIDGAGDPRGKVDVGSRVVLPFLRSAGIRWVNTVYLSHAHPDHGLGLFPLFAALPVDRLRIGQAKPGGILIQDLAKAAIKKGIALENINPFTHPLYPLEENDRSLVLRLGYKKFSALFPGDVEQAAEHELADTYGQSLESWALKVPHHGSCTSSHEAFLDAVQPRLAIISVGARNTFGHPCPETIERLQKALGPKRILMTSQGSVRLSTDGMQVQVEQFLENHWQTLWQEPLP